MTNKRASVYGVSKIFFILSLFFSVSLFGEQNQRIVEELASPITEIPLKSAMGAKAYNDAINSGEYNFVGNSKCRLCHRNFFIGRKNDPHDYTMERLLPTGNEKNPRCLVCHSTGYGIKTGFVDMETTPRLANIQCEGCHGPGNVHIKMAKDRTVNEAKKFTGGGFLAGGENPQVMRKMCTSCHSQRWSKSYHDLDKAYSDYKKADPSSSGK